MKWSALLRCTSTNNEKELDVGRRQRAIAVGVIAALVAASAFRALSYGSVYGIVYPPVAFVTSLVAVLYVVCTRTAPAALLEGVTYGWTLSIMLSGGLSLGLGLDPRYQLVVVLLDLCLVNQLNRRVSSVVLGVTCMWLCVFRVLSVFDLALPDLVELEHLCDCDNPPCRLKPTTSLAFGIEDLAALCVDFYLTRGFAEQVLAEKQTMEAAIHTAERVAVDLSSFDLDGAHELLQADAERLPPGLTDALHRILQNLRMYKPYLPQSCLVGLGDVDPVEIDGSVSDTTVSDPTRPPTACFVETVAARLLTDEVVTKKCTLMVTNMHDSVVRASSDVQGFVSHFGDVLHEAITGVRDHRGIVDVFVGDKIFSSFNTSRICTLHADNAVRAALKLASICTGTNSGLASGSARCGNVGCAEMRRFSMVGEVTLVSQGMERAGRALDISVLCDGAVWEDARFTLEFRRVPRQLVLRKVALPGTRPRCISDSLSGLLPLFEAVLVRDKLPASSSEWMYEMGDPDAAW